MTAAAFAKVSPCTYLSAFCQPVYVKSTTNGVCIFFKGLLALEGELTPILVQMVKSANMNGLLDSDSDSLTGCQQRVKARLHEIMQKDKDFTDEDYQKVKHVSLPKAFPIFTCPKGFICVSDFLWMTFVLACSNWKPFSGQLHEDHRKSCQNM